MKKAPFYIIACLLIIYSCGSATHTGESALSGTISNAEAGSKLTLEYLTTAGATAIDTAEIDKEGRFSFDYKVEEVGYYRVKQDDKQFITLILNPADKAILTATWDIGAHPYQITGSEESEVLRSLNEQMTMIYRTRDSLNTIYQNNPDNQEVLMNLQTVFADIMTKNDVFIKDFIRNNTSSFACLAAAEQLNPETDAEYFKMIDEGLAEKYSNSPYYQEFHKSVARMQNLSIGSEAPEIVLPNAKGEMVSLSSFRGKVVLVDFWASWCRPCRMENPNIVRAYKQFKDKGFEILGVSLDKERASWLAAIEQDQLHWTQVSDLSFWNSPVVKLYDISGIPFAVLLDREGRIIAKNLRGEELTNKLEEVLNQ